MLDLITVGIYGDDVPGFTSVSSIVDYFKSKGLSVKDVSGNIEHGWEMTLVGDPRKMFFAVCDKIPGYNSASVQDFIAEYSIDENKMFNVKNIVNKILEGADVRKTLSEVNGH